MTQSPSSEANIPLASLELLGSLPCSQRLIEVTSADPSINSVQDNIYCVTRPITCVPLHGSDWPYSSHSVCITTHVLLQMPQAAAWTTSFFCRDREQVASKRQCQYFMFK
jgi:hypothetical protein